MTPTEALAKAIHAYLDHHDDDCGCDDEAATLVPLLAADGWTVARTQDARDGEALAALREALPRPERVTIGLRGQRDSRMRPFFVHAGSSRLMYGDTIAAAADACRLALEKKP